MKAAIYYLILITFPFLVNAQWTVLPFNTGYQNHSISFINKDTGFVCNGIWQGPPPGINHTKLFKTTDGGNNWLTVVDDYTNTPICEMTYFNENFGIYRRWQDNALKTINGGITGNTILSGQPSSASNKLLQVIDTAMYVYGYNNIIHYTLNGGNSWVSKSTTAFQSFFNGGSYVELHNIKNGFVYGEVSSNTPSFHTEYIVYKTTDSCQTLQPSYYSSKPNIQYRGIKFINPTTAIMLCDNIVLRTFDLGTTWDTIHTYPSGYMALAMDSKNNFVLISGSDGTLLTSTNGGLTFQSSNSGFYPGPTNICIADANLRVAYGIYNNTIMKLQQPTTNLSEKENTELSLYPNPAENTIYLRSNLTTNKNVEIYDVTGAHIKSLTLKPFSDKISVDELNRGYYILKIISPGRIDYIKFLKQ